MEYGKKLANVTRAVSYQIEQRSDHLQHICCEGLQHATLQCILWLRYVVQLDQVGVRAIFLTIHTLSRQQRFVRPRTA